MKDKVIVPTCPKCGTYMDKVTAWVCSRHGSKTKK
jgi:ABC-type ATPase with predicted acetyltransferase domain